MKSRLLGTADSSSGGLSPTVFARLSKCFGLRWPPKGSTLLAPRAGSQRQRGNEQVRLCSRITFRRTSTADIGPPGLEFIDLYRTDGNRVSRSMGLMRRLLIIIINTIE